MADNFLFAQLQPFALSGSGALIGDTSITLKTMKDIDGNTLTMSTAFGTIGFGTLDPGNGTFEEQVSFTGLTNNSNGTTTLTGVSSVTFIAPYTATSGLLKTHSGSTPFVISNTSGFYNEFLSKDDDETINGLYTFAQFPQKSGSTTPTVAAELASKAYVDLVAGGIATTNQVMLTGTAGETLTDRQSVYQKVSDGKWYKTDATDTTKSDGVQLGIAQAAAAANATLNIVVRGVSTGMTGLTAGTVYFLSNTAGAIATSAGTTSVVIGQALTTTSIIVNERFTQVPTALEKAQIPTAGQKNALPGDDTTIAVGTTNKYVTQTGEQNQTSTFVTSTGSANAYVITLNPTPVAYATGQRVPFKANFTNTNTATINVNGLGAKQIFKLDGATGLTSGDIVSGQIVVVEYNGTGFQTTSPTAIVVANPVYGSALGESLSRSTNGTTDGTTVTLTLVQAGRVLLSFAGNMNIGSDAQAITITQKFKYDATYLNGCVLDHSSGDSVRQFPAGGAVVTPSLAAGSHTFNLALTYSTGTGTNSGSLSGNFYVSAL